jgi:AcrR family transcriptional regulator
MARVSKADESRRRILEAAREVFFEQSFERANLDEVARRAGIAKGTIYRYFDTKAELYVAVLSANADHFVARMRQTIDPSIPADEQVRRTGNFYFRHYRQNPEYFRIFWALENRGLIGEVEESLVRAVTDVWQRCLQIFADQIERGVRDGLFRPCDPWEIANIFWIVGNGLLQTDLDPARRALRAGDLEKVFEDALDLLLRGLRAPGLTRSPESAKL